MATDLDEMLGTEDDEEQPSKPKPPIDEEDLPPAPVVGAPTAQPLIPPPSASAVPAPSIPNSIPAGGAGGLSGLVGAPAQPAAPQVASPMDRYNALHAAGAPVSHKTGFGGGLLKTLDAIGGVVAPGVMGAIPGTTMHQHFQEQGALNQAKNQMGAEQEQATLANTKATTAKTQAETAGMGQPKPKEEEWSVVPGIQGPNGEPVQQEKNSGQVRVAPLQGASLVDKTKQSPAHVTYDSGIPVSVVGQDGKVYDVNDPKLPPELKPLVDAANRAHGQHVTEDTTKQANAFSHADTAAANREGQTAQNQTEREARGELNKAKHSFEDATQRAEDLQSFTNAAAAGNSVASAEVPLEGTLVITTANGVKRINRTEVDQFAGAGSLFDKISNAVKKAGTGVAQDQRIIKDINDLAGIIKDNATKTYQRQYEDTVDQYGLDRNKYKPVLSSRGGGEAGGKTYTDAEVQAAAMAHGMKPADIEKAYKNKGYTKKEGL